MEKDKKYLPRRLSVIKFFEMYDVKRSDIAEKLGVHRQQITNWQASPTEYLIEYDPIKGIIRVIRPEEILKSCSCVKLDTK